MGAMANRLGIVIERTVSGWNNSVPASRVMERTNKTRRSVIPTLSRGWRQRPRRVGNRFNVLQTL